MSTLEYELFKKMLAEQQKTNELLTAQNELIKKGGFKSGNTEQSKPTNTGKPVKNNNGTGNKRGL